ncbi:MAG: RtcB family protein [Gemmataceae bacterium]
MQYLKHQAARPAANGPRSPRRSPLRRGRAQPDGADRRCADHGINRRFVGRGLYAPVGRSAAVAGRVSDVRSLLRLRRNAGERPRWDGVGGGAVDRAASTTTPAPCTTSRWPPRPQLRRQRPVVSNCGVRLVRSNLFYREVKPHLRTLIDELFRSVPTGVGRSGKYKFNHRELQHLMGQGMNYLVGRGLATSTDIDHTEAAGQLLGADPALVSDHAMNRGAEQCGTLGSGNHFLEVQVVDHVFDEEAAAVMGLEKDLICVMIHSGSRGLGYQVCDDALAALRKAPEKYGIALPDRQLACAPATSPEGQRYIGAMRAAANYAWCNRQLLMMQAREVFARVFGRSWQELQMGLIYDVCHNIAKLEEHTVDGKLKKVWVHRKGATRAFPPGHPEVPSMYRGIGQPVIIPGDMGRASWVLVGQPGSMARTFGTTCHGAGRVMSRTAAIRATGSRRIDKELESRGVIARAQSRKGLAEEQPDAYKNVDDVVDVVDAAGLSKKVARMRPIGVIKG